MTSADDTLPPNGPAMQLIVMKLIAMRPQDETDIQDLLAAYPGKLDLEFVRAELETFTDANDPRRARFETWVRQTKAL